MRLRPGGRAEKRQEIREDRQSADARPLWEYWTRMIVKKGSRFETAAQMAGKEICLPFVPTMCKLCKKRDVHWSDHGATVQHYTIIIFIQSFGVEHLWT